MVDIQERIDLIEERAKRIGEALDDAADARERARQDVESLPHDLAELREELRRIRNFPIADSLERGP